jgi:hypothetical protein
MAPFTTGEEQLRLERHWKQQELNMRHYLRVAAAAVVAASFDISLAMAGQPDLGPSPQAGVPSHPSVEVVAVRASRLHLGMTAAEVGAIMGQGTKTADYRNADTALQTLDFSAEPIRSKVTLTNGKVSHVALDVCRVDPDDLPVFTRVAWPGLNSATVLRLLGKPYDVRHYAFFDIKVDQLIFRRAGEPDVSLFFVADRLIAKRVGQDIPVDIFQVNLPSSLDATGEEAVEGPVQVGMKASDVKTLYGAARLEVPYNFNGQAAEHAIYETRPGGPFVSLTSVDGIVTEFADIGRLPDDDVFAGR